ncbi:MAG: oligosaccharide flippase family protein [Rubrivivax sp.]|nr:oligosaccharide flippase family protein [Rubrivivax sp.]
MQLVGTVVMARLLTPAEVGTFAVAAVFAAMAGAMRNFGTSEFLIQEAKLDDSVVRAANGVVLVVSWSLGLLLNLLAQPIGAFYGASDVATLIRVLSISFFLTPFAAVTLATFRRELQMRPAFITNFTSNLLGLATGIGLALQGFGAASLAWSTVAGAVTAVLLALLFKPRSLPLAPSLVGARRIFAFGKHVTGVYAFGQVGAGAPDAIIGKAAGVTAVAYFSRANGLIELFNRLVLYAIWPVVMPVFARSAREPGGVQATYLAGTGYLTAIAWPILFLMGLLAFPAIRVFYGDQWVASVPPAQILCIAAALGVSYHLTKDTLLAIGQARQCNLLQFKVHALRICGIALVVPFGMNGASWGIVAGTAVGLVLTHRSLHAATGLVLADVLAALLPSLRIAVLSVLPAWALAAAFPPDAGNYLAVGLGGSALTVAAWCWLLRREKHPLWAEVTAIARRLAPATRSER